MEALELELTRTKNQIKLVEDRLMVLFNDLAQQSSQGLYALENGMIPTSSISTASKIDCDLQRLKDLREQRDMLIYLQREGAAK